ncbi:MAG: hypothetical protein HQ567_23820, partial [Candidatus Nealsonbacteria bacterium]|nr:hypothetical protein [Candidatus Nealsonbacteria bacterium]
MFRQFSVVSWQLAVSVSVLALAAIWAPAPARAAWWDDEAGDGLWSNPTNWSNDALPAADNKVVVDGGYTATITDDVPATANARLGLGVGGNSFGGGADGGFVGLGGNGTVIQTGGTASYFRSSLNIGSGSGVGTYRLEDGRIYASNTGGYNVDVRIGWDNSAALAPSGFIQNGGEAMFKSLSLACNGDNAKAYYTMNGGTLGGAQYGFNLTTGGTGQEGVFTQNDGVVSTGDWQDNTIKMGSGVGDTGAAIWNLNGGALAVGTVRGADDANLGFVFNSSINTYVDIAGGTLVLADDLGVDGGNWDYDRFIATYDTANFRSFGADVTAASQLLFTPTTVTLESNMVSLKTYNATAITAVATGTTFTWGGGSGNWSSLNWDDDGGELVLPAANAEMIIDAAGSDVTVTVDATSYMPAGPVTVANDASLAVEKNATLTVNGEVAVGPDGTLSVDGTLVADSGSVAGTLAGSGTINAAPIDVTGTVAPGGAGIGALTLGSGELGLDPAATYEAQVSLAVVKPIEADKSTQLATDQIVLADGNVALQMGGTLAISSLGDRTDAGYWAASPVIIDNTVGGVIGKTCLGDEEPPCPGARFDAVTPAPPALGEPALHLGQGLFLRGGTGVTYDRPGAGNVTHAVELDVLVALGGDGDGKVWLSDWAALRA